MKRHLLSALLAIGMILSVLPAAAAAGGGINTKDANAVRWIDRVELPDYAITLYETLEEAADGDGCHDYLIDDKYFDLSGNFDSSLDGKPGDYKRLKLASSAYACIIVTSVETSALDENKEHIYDCIRTAYAAFHMDHPEVFWLGTPGYASYAWNGRVYFMCVLARASDDSSATEIRISEFRTDGSLDVREAMAKRDADIEKILGTVPAGADRFTQVYYLNKWLTENNQYNTTISGGLGSGLDNSEIDRPWDSSRCVSALAGSEGANGPECGGYANAFKVLCDALGIPCVHVRGNVRNSDGSLIEHSWNYVQMEDGKWYAVDTTWNDPGRNAAGKLSGYERADYLLIGRKTVVDGTEF